MAMAAVAAASQSGRYELRRPLAILMALLLLLTLPLACNSGGGDNSSSNGNGSNDSSPGAPTALTAAANGSTAIDLSWSAPASNGGSAIAGYRIFFKKEGAADYSPAETDTGNTETSYIHAGLEAETEYSYQVSAINANGAGPASNEATATTASPAADPKPGAPANFVATAGAEKVTLSWTDPMHCGNGDLCSETAHEHYLEYKLTSAADDAWANGQAVADSPLGPSHTTTYAVEGLTGSRSYDFRLAIQLTDETERGPWVKVSAEPQVDSDGDGVANTSDAFLDDACASIDSDGDGAPDTVLAAGSTAPGGSAACSAASTLVADAFPDDACASVDRDGNGMPDAIIAPGDSDDDACTVASTLTPDEDSDGDGVIDNLDVDDDNNGLIEIATRAELDNMRHNLAGSSYDDEAEDSGSGDSGDTSGAPATEPANCSDVDTDGDDNPTNDTVLLCGYELANDIDLGGTTSASSDDPPDISCASNEWTPIGGCGSNGECGEADSNDDDPFTAILEGNGHTISNLCIEAVVESPTDQLDVLGLFGHLGGATVQNLTIAEVYIESSFTGGDSSNRDDNSPLGALVGYVTGDAAILNVAAEDSDSDIDLQGATTNDVQTIGGLVGYQTEGNIIASFATGTADGGEGSNDRVGGLVGYQTGGSITASFATGTADGGAGNGDVVGGLLGYQEGGSIVASYATGDADSRTGDDSITGGLVGYRDGGSIAASFATGNADSGDGSDRVGGLVGFQTGGSIAASYATGAVDGGAGSSDGVGGLVGDLDGGSITASFATGDADGGTGSSDRVGGLVGLQIGGSIVASYSFGTATGEIAGSAGSDKPSGVMTAAHLAGDSGNPTTYAGASWSTDVWDFGSGTQAPALKYISGYAFDDGDDDMIGTSDDTHTYSCAAAEFPTSLSVACGTTLLPGQR